MSDFNNNNSIQVQNINGTSSVRYTINNLPKKYLGAGGTDSNFCQVKGCDNPWQATAHVILTDGRRSDAWFLVRTCARHNAATQPYFLRKNANLIPVRDITGT